MKIRLLLGAAVVVLAANAASPPGNKLSTEQKILHVLDGITCAGVDDTFHAKQSVEFYMALFNAKIPVEMHLYGHGGHGGSIDPRKGIPFGTWPTRFLEWAKDLKLMEAKK